MSVNTDNPFIKLSAEDRLRAHAKAAKATSAARAEYDMLSIGEHPDVLEDAWDTLVAATRAERLAFQAYTDPFGVKTYA